MRAVVQRVVEAAVEVEDKVVAQIGPGLAILVGVGTDDTDDDAEVLVQKIANLRLFSDEAGRMNRSILETGGAALVVSQFTLYADIRKGRRPSWVQAAPASRAEPLVERFGDILGLTGVPVSRGRFGAHMLVRLINDGPVTVLVESVEGRLV